MNTKRRPIFAMAALSTLAFCSLSGTSTKTRAQETPAQPSASTSAAAEPPAPKRVSTYAWPTEPSAKPKEAEWASATPLEAGINESNVPTPIRGRVECEQQALREWMRVRCKAPNIYSGDILMFGSIWGLAGDVKSVSTELQTAGSLDLFKEDPEQTSTRLQRGMGAIATITFQVKPGNAFMLRLESIRWSEGYDGGNVELGRGVVIDVSWALGEKGPTVRYY